MQLQLRQAHLASGALGLSRGTVGIIAILAFEFPRGNANVYGLLLAKFRARKSGR